ncbi:MAG: hypothetical protein CMH64_04005 [Nanoarchaeota archaeon]|nr:hypothetical protein [Nanoarchaeota archaeon]
MKLNTKTFMAIFIAVIMISSVLGFVFTFSPHSTGGAERIEFQNYVFVETHQGWMGFDDNENQILLSSDPRTVSTIQVPEISLVELNSANKVYVTSNPEDNLQNSAAYFEANIRPRLKSYLPACSADVKGCENAPLIDCSNALPATKVIQVALSNQSSVTYNNNCLLVQGNRFQVPLIFDALILKLSS